MLTIFFLVCHNATYIMQTTRSNLLYSTLAELPKMETKSIRTIFGSHSAIVLVVLEIRSHYGQLRHKLHLTHIIVFFLLLGYLYDRMLWAIRPCNPIRPKICHNQNGNAGGRFQPQERENDPYGLYIICSMKPRMLPNHISVIFNQRNLIGSYRFHLYSESVHVCVCVCLRIFFLSSPMAHLYIWPESIG